MERISLSASYFIRDSADLDNITELANYPIQLGIYKLNDNFLDEVYRTVEKNNIKINSIHLPKLTPDDTSYFRRIHEATGVSNYTIHPDKRTLYNALAEWNPIVKDLKNENIYLGFENSRSSRSWLQNPFDIQNTPIQITLDVQHLSKDIDEINAFDILKDNILIVHLCDREKTGPYKRIREFLPHIFTNPQIEYVLEYGRQYVPIMKRDHDTIIKLLDDYGSSKEN